MVKTTILPLTNPRYTVVHVEDHGWIVTHHVDYDLDRAKRVAATVLQTLRNQNKQWQVKVLEKTVRGYRVAWIPR